MEKFNNIYGSKIYGKNRYGHSLDLDIPEGYNFPNLMRYLPKYYHESIFTIELQDGFSKELGLLDVYKDDLLKQFFISTATWGLAVYEKELGIPTNPSLSYEDRREIIIAKIRGRGTTTKQMIRSTAEAFSGGEVDIVEHHDEYRFTVKFVGVIGVPKNMKSFIQMLDEIKPAHLAYDFEYTYTTCQMLIDWGVLCNTLTDGKVTCKDLKSFTLEEVV